jgi:hypothetical protein
VIGGLYKLGREESTWRVEGRGELVELAGEMG